MYLLGFLGYLDGPGGPGGGGAGRIWRWLVWAACLVLEYHVATRPGDRILWGLLEGAINPLLSRFTTHPPLVPFQLVALVRQCSVVTYIAMAQLGPAVAAEMEWQRQRHGGGGGQAASMAQASGSAADQELLLRRGLDALEQQVKVLGVDADRMLALELAPFAGDDDAMRDVGVAARRWLVQNTVRSDPMVRDAIGRSRQRRRADAPAGARGNR